jgi:hypothetical protein
VERSFTTRFTNGGLHDPTKVLSGSSFLPKLFKLGKIAGTYTSML